MELDDILRGVVAVLGGVALGIYFGGNSMLVGGIVAAITTVIIFYILQS